MYNRQLEKFENKREGFKDIYKLYNDFIKISENTDIYFGGNKEWYKDKKQRRRGCAPVAAANITAYFAKYLRCKGLYDYNTVEFKKDDFEKHMEDLYKEIAPSLFRNWDNHFFIKRIKNYAKRKNINLVGKSMILYKTSEEELFEDFCENIKEGLTKNSPVALFIGVGVPSKKYKEEDINPTSSVFKYCWITITEYFVFQDEQFIKISSGGKSYLLNLNALKSRRAWLSCVYFKIK